MSQSIPGKLRQVIASALLVGYPVTSQSVPEQLRQGIAYALCVHTLRTSWDILECLETTQTRDSLCPTCIYPQDILGRPRVSRDNSDKGLPVPYVYTLWTSWDILWCLETTQTEDRLCPTCVYPQDNLGRPRVSLDNLDKGQLAPPHYSFIFSIVLGNTWTLDVSPGHYSTMTMGC